MRRFFVSCVLVLCVSLAISFTMVHAGEKDISVKLNGQTIDFPDAKPYVNEDGRTLVPVRFVAEKLGAKVGWDGENNSVSIKLGETQMMLAPGSKTGVVNGKETQFDTAPVSKEGRTFVPLRVISETLGTEVSWDKTTRTVFITTPDYQLINWYTVPKNKTVEIHQLEELGNYGIVISLSKSESMEKQLSETKDILASRLGDEAASKTVDSIKADSNSVIHAENEYVFAKGRKIVIQWADKIYIGVCAADISEIEPSVLEAPQFQYYRSGYDSSQFKPVELVKVSEKQNNITDDDVWFANNGLSLPTYIVPNEGRNISGNLPVNIPAELKGKILVKAIHYGDTTLLIYGENYSGGNYVVAMDDWQNIFKYAFDFGNYTYAPDNIKEDTDFVDQTIQWAREEKGILYVAHSHSTYAKSSKGMNAYITAINIENGEVIWRSQPLVCNSSNFEIYGDVIISGYGFTDEPDYLYTINKYTGEISSKLKLKTGPSYIINKDGMLYVRCYDTDYIFKIEAKK